MTEIRELQERLIALLTQFVTGGYTFFFKDSIKLDWINAERAMHGDMSVDQFATTFLKMSDEDATELIEVLDHALK